ncbi:MAG: vWA domain-containing protein [Pseudomonadota bacterium]
MHDDDFGNGLGIRSHPLGNEFNECVRKLAPVLKDLEKKPSRHKVIFVVDGSGSMAFEDLPEWNTPCSPNRSPMLENILMSIASLQGGVKNVPVISGFWGEQDGVKWHRDALQNPENIQKLKTGLGCSTDLAPALTEMISLATSTAGSGTRLHFVLVSDGDLVDEPNARRAMELLLGENGHVTLDFVLTGRATTVVPVMRNLAVEMKKKYKSQVGEIKGFEKNASLGEVHGIFTDVIGNHVNLREQRTNPGLKLHSPS